MKLRWRITIPFALLFACAYIATALVAVSLVAGAVERRLIYQTENLARVLAGFPGLREKRVLDHIRNAYGAEVHIFPGAPLPPFQATRNVVQANGAIYAPISSDFSLILVYNPHVISEEKVQAAKPVILVAAGAFLLVILFGLLTARSIARPLEKLAQAARSISVGQSNVELPAAQDGELRDLAEALNRMLTAVRTSEQLATIGHLSASVAHEIKNPLSAMKMTLHMLREERPASAREPYDLLLREIDRLELVANELSVATPRSPNVRLVSLETLVREVLDLLRPQLDHLHISVTESFDPVPHVRLDVDRFKRVIMNLILNGAQAMPQGGPLHLTLTANESRVRFAVTDVGKGIAPDLQPRLFEPFVTTKSDGVGLGLVLTKRIVEEQGGKIGFTTSEQGTSFWVELPAG